MQAPSASGRIITDINVTPLVDVCLVLVIIFMVVAPFAMQASIQVAASKVGAARGEAALKKNVSVVLDDQGRVSVNGRAVGWEGLNAALKTAIGQSQDRMVGLEASPKARVGRVVEILDDSKQDGAGRVALVNKE